jgi:hypothetical protein
MVEDWMGKVEGEISNGVAVVTNYGGPSALEGVAFATSTSPPTHGSRTECAVQLPLNLNIE